MNNLSLWSERYFTHIRTTFRYGVNRTTLAHERYYALSTQGQGIVLLLINTPTTDTFRAIRPTLISRNTSSSVNDLA